MANPLVAVTGFKLDTPEDWAAWFSFVDWYDDLLDDLKHRLLSDESVTQCWWSDGD